LGNTTKQGAKTPTAQETAMGMETETAMETAMEMGTGTGTVMVMGMAWVIPVEPTKSVIKTPARSVARPSNVWTAA
jgi:hypothetical protein